MKITIVVANCCEDSKVAVDNNTSWDPYVKRNTIGHKCTVFDRKITELRRMKDHFSQVARKLMEHK